MADLEKMQREMKRQMIGKFIYGGPQPTTIQPPELQPMQFQPT
ncbi:hypothetical protein [Variovorax sp. RA8]|nr:hypothetical protein [Variovorax sp. RA8]